MDHPAKHPQQTCTGAVSRNRGKHVVPLKIAFVLLMASVAFPRLPAQAARNSQDSPVSVVLSTDVGNEIDDQWAVAWLLTDPAFDVRGILSAHAPSLPDPAAHSSYLLLRTVVEKRLGMMTHPPLIEGASVPLPDTATPRPSDAARFLMEQSRGFTPQHRLTVLTIGAATDVASALLMEPALVDRIRVVAMAFTTLKPDGAKEFNAENDPHAWQVLLRSRVPLVTGTGDVCRATLSLNYAQADALLRGHESLGAWLWDDYRFWYFGHVKPMRSADFSRNWVIWDIITLAYVRGLATTQSVPRPTLTDDMRFQPGSGGSTLENITAVDTAQVWKELFRHLDLYQQTHATPKRSGHRSCAEEFQPATLHRGPRPHHAMPRI